MYVSILNRTGVNMIILLLNAKLRYFLLLSLKLDLYDKNNLQIN